MPKSASAESNKPPRSDSTRKMDMLATKQKSAPDNMTKYGEMEGNRMSSFKLARPDSGKKNTG